MIRLEAEMTAARFARLVGASEAQLSALAAAGAAGTAGDRVEPAAIEYADRFPTWGHRKVAMLMRVDGLHAPDATVLARQRQQARAARVDVAARVERHRLALRGPYTAGR